jgi:hypothetical protein
MWSVFEGCVKIWANKKKMFLEAQRKIGIGSPELQTNEHRSLSNPGCFCREESKRRRKPRSGAEEGVTLYGIRGKTLDETKDSFSRRRLPEPIGF